MAEAAMKKAFVVGHPIAHSRSPLIHGHWLATLGIHGSYERIDIHPDAIDAFAICRNRASSAATSPSRTRKLRCGRRTGWTTRPG
jgi:shikimate 5-dehydrogenase